ncbi:hypothetical protein VP1G_04693 [Cytospora mali]|uniref:Uncharacterized protein n=1 Tax=Cytospora mali TaxID=578113 RepID=A0A194V0H2_CYTMA|nr:hypothetical protein VP1G_04693 [Valsa mali var. pyri (nom. inval.)]
MAPSARLLPANTTTDIQHQVSLWFTRLVQAVADFLAGIQDEASAWFSHVMRAVVDFFSSIWQSISDFPGFLLDLIIRGLKGAGGFVLSILARAGAFILSVLLQLLQWAVIVLAVVTVLALVLNALIKYFEGPGRKLHIMPRDQEGGITRKPVRTWHPDNQRFIIGSNERVRHQAAEMTKILNGMLV